MYSRTNPRIERKIMLVFWIVVFAMGLLVLGQTRSVHVTSVRRKKEDDGTTVFSIEVANPTKQNVTATICLATGTYASDSASPWGNHHHKRVFELPASITTVVEIRFEPAQARLLGNVYSANVFSVEPSPRYKLRSEQDTIQKSKPNEAER